MSKSDKQHLRELTLAVIASRQYPYGVNCKYGIVLKYFPIVQSLIDDGLLLLQRHGTRTKMGSPGKKYGRAVYSTLSARRTLLVAKEQVDGGIVYCPCCNGKVTQIPERDLTEHRKDCRLRVCYGTHSSAVKAQNYYHNMMVRIAVRASKCIKK